MQNFFYFVKTTFASFEPKLAKKHQTTISDEIEDKILSMYGLRMSYRDNLPTLKKIYQVSISTVTISEVIDKIK